MLTRSVLAVLLGATLASASPQFGAPWKPSAEQLRQWMAEGGHPLTGSERIPELRTKVLRRLQDSLSLFISESSAKYNAGSLRSTAGLAANASGSGFHPFGLEKYPYFGFIPEYLGSVKPGDNAGISWSAPCFAENKAYADASQDGGRSVTIHFSRSSASSLLCTDHYLLTTLQGLWTTSFFFSGKSSMSWNTENMSPALQWNLQNKGIRVFRFRDDFLQTIVDILDTVSLFIPAALESGISPEVAERNLYFMEHYASQPMRPRAIKDVEVDESLIHSGDFLGVVRLDGLDPMLAWAMGSTTGHTTVALRIDGELYITESTVKDSHWPTDGVQKTPYKLWVQQAKAAGYQVVWAPLTPEARARFNETAAVEFFKTVEGLEYGYRTLLFGWLDTPQDNYPCLPPDFKTCMSWPFAELIFGMLDALSPPTADMLFGQALNNRMGTWGLRAPELLQAAGEKGIDASVLPTLVERDDFVYNTTRNGQPVMGRSMVCCVFVCNIWKAAGIFSDLDNEVNCGELTNWDDYSLDILVKNPDRPEQCKQADPDNNLCQLTGDYTLVLNDYSTKSPYRHMAERCPSLAPDYKKPADC